MWNQTPGQFAETLRAQGLRRAYVISDPQTDTLRASHAALQPLANDIQSCPDFRQHEACFFELGQRTGHLLAVFVHATARGQAAGGVRFWPYDQLGGLVRDGLRLSLAMGQKCALAGLWWGGGKGVIARQPAGDHGDSPQLRREVYRDFGCMLSGLRGCYVTAEDVGTRPEDMAEVFAATRHTTCIPQVLGGSGNPSALTAQGVVVAMRAALEYGALGGLAGKTIAVQGLGQVTEALITELLARGVARIIGVDIDPRRVAAVGSRFAGDRVRVRQVGADDQSILAEPCDIVSPNAIGGTLNPRSIPQLKASVVCGGANNQLQDVDRDGPALSERDILYVPDVVANRMGIVNCANEQYGAFSSDPAVARHLDRDAPTGIFQTTLQVLRRAQSSGRSTAQEADQLAGELAAHSHPIWPGRARQIMTHLVQTGWDKG